MKPNTPSLGMPKWRRRDWIKLVVLIIAILLLNWYLN